MTETRRLRAKPGSLALAEGAPFCRPFVHMADCPIDDMLRQGYFASDRAALMPGDKIRLVSVRAGRVREIQEVTVVAVTPTEVEFFRHERITIREERQERQEESAGLLYVNGNGSIQWNAGRKLFVVTVGDKEVAAVREKDLALAIANGSEPIPEVEAA